MFTSLQSYSGLFKLEMGIETFRLGIGIGLFRLEMGIETFRLGWV